ncbi:hypothetical protein KKC74_05860 [bacterium]|nr:hypothetical protein [bacterium]MBU1064317.1 hypothetical protein [bacterium]MBU1873332.1 hypothetical protein [bacterium]
MNTKFESTAGRIITLIIFFFSFSILFQQPLFASSYPDQHFIISGADSLLRDAEAAYNIIISADGNSLQLPDSVLSGYIVVTGKNFGAGSSRQQAVDCFKALNVPLILAESYGAIYERNAINAALPILSYDKALITELELRNGDTVTVNLESGAIQNQRSGKSGSVQPFSRVQMDIYKRGGLLNK